MCELRLCVYRSLAIFLVVGLFVQTSGCRAAPQRAVLQPGVNVTAYEAELTLDPETRRLDGRVRVHVQHQDSVQNVRLFLVDMTIDAVQVDGEPVDAVRNGGQLLVPVPPGRSPSVIEVAYHGVPTRGLYAAAHDGQQVVFTDSWPTRARGWLPSIDHPSDPAAITLTLRVPLGYETVANGERIARDTVGGQVVSTWELSKDVPTYSMAFAVSDFAPTCTTISDTPPVCYYLLEPDSSLANKLHRTPESLNFLSNLLGPYPYDNYQVVQIPIGYAGMENAALPFLKADLFHADGLVESTQVHEAVHQWFGDRVVIARWRDLWLSEGVATYFTTLFYEHFDGLEEARRRWVEMVDVPTSALEGAVLVPDHPVEPGQFLSWVPYQKGASVLHLLRLRMGDEAFFAAMREVYQRYAGSPLTTAAFVNILQQHADMPLDGIVDYWVYSAQYPTLEVTWRAETGTLEWTIRGDKQTLDNVPFMLQITVDGAPIYVPVGQKTYTVKDSSGDPPTVRPVGILMDVQFIQQ